MNKYQEALNTLTDWFHSYENEKGITVHERHITPKYEDAKKTIRELIDKSIIFDNIMEAYQLYIDTGNKIIEELKKENAKLKRFETDYHTALAFLEAQKEEMQDLRETIKIIKTSIKEYLKNEKGVEIELGHLLFSYLTPEEYELLKEVFKDGKEVEECFTY